jgi:hypothetical protein
MVAPAIGATPFATFEGSDSIPLTAPYSSVHCSVWPGQPITAHWGVPEAIEGSDDTKIRAFSDAAVTLRKRIELFKSLPLASLDRLALQKEVTDIGKSSA